jgi:hypothetical protein
MAKGRKTGGRKKGTPNKRLDLQEFVDSVETRIDLAELAKKFLSGKNPSERVFLRLLEYRYGKPPQIVPDDHLEPSSLTINVSAIPSSREPVD